MKKIINLIALLCFSVVTFAQTELKQLDPYSWEGWKSVRNGLPVQAHTRDVTIGYVFACPVYRDRDGVIHTPANENANPYEKVYIEVYVTSTDGQVYSVPVVVSNPNADAAAWENRCVRTQNVSLEKTNGEGYMVFYRSPLSVRVVRSIDPNGEVSYSCNLFN